MKIMRVVGVLPALALAGGASAGSIQSLTGSVQLDVGINEDHEGRLGQEWGEDVSETYAVEFPEMSHYDITRTAEVPDEGEYTGVAGVEYRLEEVGDGAVFDVFAFATAEGFRSRYDEPHPFDLADASFTITFTTTRDMTYRFEAFVPDYTTDFRAVLDGVEASARVDPYFGEFDGTMVVDDPETGPRFDPFLATGVLRAGTHTFTVDASWVDSAGRAIVTLSVPSPAAAALGVALLSLGAMRRRR